MDVNECFQPIDLSLDSSPPDLIEVFSVSWRLGQNNWEIVPPKNPLFTRRSFFVDICGKCRKIITLIPHECIQDTKYVPFI